MTEEDFQGAHPDQLSHSRSKPGNNLAREHFVNGLIFRYMVSQRSGVAYAKWCHFQHTAPSLNTLVNFAALVLREKYLKSNVSKQRQNIYIGTNFWWQFLNKRIMDCIHPATQ